MEIIKTALLLTGALHGTKAAVGHHLASFKKYDWVWKADKAAEHARFAAAAPTTSDYEAELRRFSLVELELDRAEEGHAVGALALNTANLKLQLKAECRLWKVLYSAEAHKRAKQAMRALAEYMKVVGGKLRLEVRSIESLRYMLSVLREVREREASIDLEISPILDLYGLVFGWRALYIYT